MAKTEQPSSTDSPGERRDSAIAEQTVYVDPYHDLLDRLARAELSDPAGVLGPHPVDRPGGRALAIRTIQPTAIDVRVRLTEGGEEFPARPVHPSGIFEAILPASAAVRAIPGGYKFRVQYDDGSSAELHDPYNFPRLLTDFDIYLMGEGTHHGQYEKLGAHVREIARVRECTSRSGLPTRCA